MEQENDYIKREIQKLTMVLKKLSDKTISVDINNFQAVVSETDEKLLLMIDLANKKNNSFSFEKMNRKTKPLQKINSNKH